MARLALLLLLAMLLPGAARAQLGAPPTPTEVSKKPDSSITQANQAPPTNGAPAASNAPASSGAPAASPSVLSPPPAPSQVSAETVRTTFWAMSQFTQTMLDPFVGGRSYNSVSVAGADDLSTSAYASIGSTRGGLDREVSSAVYGKAPLAGSLSAPRWNVWAAGIGGAQISTGSAMPGSGPTSSRIFGTEVGADFSLSPQTMVGFAMAGGTYFSSSSFGGGHSDLFQTGAFVRHTTGQAYVAGAMAYGWQAVTSDRMMTPSPGLNGGLDTTAYSGRVEGGYQFATSWLGIAAYAAGQIITFNLPAGAGQPLPGAGASASAFSAVSATDSRSELGMRTSKSLGLLDGVLTLRGRLAWAYDFSSDCSGNPSLVRGAIQPPNSALTGASAEIGWFNGWLVAATFDGEFSSTMRSYGGRGIVRYAW